jgi:acyl-coenzyme A thioesterase PaaI-like protein
MTRNMEVDYLRPVPSGAPIRLEGRVTESHGRKHWAASRILNSDGIELAKGKGLFIEVHTRKPAKPEDESLTASRPAT